MNGDILVVGSCTLVNALEERDLADECRLMVFPIVLGSGVRLFDGSADATTPELVGAHPLANAAVVLTCRQASAGGSRRP